MARPLLCNFFTSIMICADNTSTSAGCLRFAHAETIIPFATMLEIPGISGKSVDLSNLYMHENDVWCGEHVSPMAANIQWEIYRHEINHQQILVRMLYNEVEVRFKEDCQPISSDSFFYDINELKRAYAHLFRTISSTDD
jgi:hypothetical protein